MLDGFRSPCDFAQEARSRPLNLVFFPDSTLIRIANDWSGEFSVVEQAESIAEIAVRFFLRPLPDCPFWKTLIDCLGERRFQLFRNWCEEGVIRKPNPEELREILGDWDAANSERICARFQRLFLAEGMIPVYEPNDGDAYLLPFHFSEERSLDRPRVLDAEDNFIDEWSKEVNDHIPLKIEHDVRIDFVRTYNLPEIGSSLLLPILVAWWRRNRLLARYNPFRILFTGSFLGGTLRCVKVEEKRQKVESAVKDGVLVYPVPVSEPQGQETIREGDTAQAVLSAVSKIINRRTDAKWEELEQQAAQANTMFMAGSPLRDFPSRAQLVLGREQDINRINELFKEKPIVILHARGGQGKTTLAMKFGNQMEETFPGGLLWLDAERLHNWEEVFSNLKHLLPRTDENATKADVPVWQKVRDFLENGILQTGPLLLVLDNVEETGALFSNEPLLKVFPKGVPVGFHVLATARNWPGPKTDVDQVDRFPLDQLSHDSSRELLLSIARGENSTNNPEPLSPSEEKALEGILRLAGGHPWSIRIIGGRIKGSDGSDGDGATPLSFQEALSLYRDYEAFPWESKLRPTLDQLGKKKGGETRLDLATAIALLAEEGTVYSQVVRHVWETVIDPGESSGKSFQQESEKLLRYSMVDSVSGDSITMHRLTQTVLVHNSSEQYRKRVGDVLKNYPGLDLERWPQFLDSGIPGSCCPLNLLDPSTLHDVLKKHPEILSPEIVRTLDAEETAHLLFDGLDSSVELPWNWNSLESLPEYRGTDFDIEAEEGTGTAKDPWENNRQFPGVFFGPRGEFNAAYWTDVLCRRPTLASHCRFDRLSHDDLWVITHFHPELMDNNPFFTETTKGRVHWIAMHSDLTGEEHWTDFNQEDWWILLRAHPDLQSKAPREILQEWLNDRDGQKALEAYEEEYGSSRDWEEYDTDEGESLEDHLGVPVLTREEFLQSEDAWAVSAYLVRHPEDADARTLFLLEPDNWVFLYTHHPGLADEFGIGKMSGASPSDWAYLVCKVNAFDDAVDFYQFSAVEWTRILSARPELWSEYAQCIKDGNRVQRITGENWVDILHRQPRLLPHCDLDALDGKNWGEILGRFPSLAPECPWSMLTPPDWAPLVVEHPDWIPRYGLDLSRLTNDQWIPLLDRNPNFAPQCHVPFYNDKRLVSLLLNHPSLVSQLDCSCLSGDSWAQLIEKDVSLLELCPKARLFIRGEKNAPWAADPVLPWVSLMTMYRGKELFAAAWIRTGMNVPWERFSGRDWAALLCSQPHLFSNCDWTKLGAGDWITLLQRQRQFAPFLSTETMDDESVIQLFHEHPWLEQCLPQQHPILRKREEIRERVWRICESGNLVVPVSRQEVLVDHPKVKRLRETPLAFPLRDQIKSLIEWGDVAYFPDNPSASYRKLAEACLENLDIADEEKVPLIKRILLLLLRHDCHKDVLALTSALSAPSDGNNAPSVLIDDRLTRCCVAESYWVGGSFHEAIKQFRLAQSIPGPRQVTILGFNFDDGANDPEKDYEGDQDINRICRKWYWYRDADKRLTYKVIEECIHHCEVESSRNLADFHCAKYPTHRPIRRIYHLII